MSAAGAATLNNGLTLTDGNLTVADGHGIDFSATSDGAGTDNSSLLHDYEEGTFTPAYIQGGNSPTAHSTQVGHYVKVGRVIHASGYVTVNGLASMSGTIFITGFPYGSVDATNYYQSFNVGYYENLNLPTANTGIMGYMNPDSTSVRLTIGNQLATSPPMTAAILSGDGGLIFTCTYRTAV